MVGSLSSVSVDIVLIGSHPDYMNGETGRLSSPGQLESRRLWFLGIE